MRALWAGRQRRLGWRGRGWWIRGPVASIPGGPSGWFGPCCPCCLNWRPSPAANRCGVGCGSGIPPESSASTPGPWPVRSPMPSTTTASTGPSSCGPGRPVPTRNRARLPCPPASTGSPSSTGPCASGWAKSPSPCGWSGPSSGCAACRPIPPPPPCGSSASAAWPPFRCGCCRPSVAARAWTSTCSPPAPTSGGAAPTVADASAMPWPWPIPSTPTGCWRRPAWRPASAGWGRNSSSCSRAPARTSSANRGSGIFSCCPPTPLC